MPQDILDTNTPPPLLLEKHLSGQLHYWFKHQYTAAKKIRKMETPVTNTSNPNSVVILWYIETLESLEASNDLKDTIHRTANCSLHPEMTYGDNYWKAQQLATDDYSLWYNKKVNKQKCLHVSGSSHQSSSSRFEEEHPIKKCQTASTPDILDLTTAFPWTLPFPPTRKPTANNFYSSGIFEGDISPTPDGTATCSTSSISASSSSSSTPNNVTQAATMIGQKTASTAPGTSTIEDGSSPTSPNEGSLQQMQEHQLQSNYEKTATTTSPATSTNAVDMVTVPTSPNKVDSAVESPSDTESTSHSGILVAKVSMALSSRIGVKAKTRKSKIAVVGKAKTAKFGKFHTPLEQKRNSKLFCNDNKGMEGGWGGRSKGMREWGSREQGECKSRESRAGEWWEQRRGSGAAGAWGSRGILLDGT
ncbi:hypothetical protein BDQ17DRAFT_1330671 [Cyathus striatus]|nr:hypothetical protein BDQ17DRAFT_1330671 [Cyathus striatus]